MSKPKAPYYYKKRGDTYHWEKDCSKNHYSKDNPEWEKTEKEPSNKEKCNECKNK